MRQATLGGVVLAAAMVVGWAVLRADLADERHPAAEGQVGFRAVIHVNFADADRQKHGLNNVSNMVKAEGGKREIEVVCHGSGISLLVRGKTAGAEEIQKLMKDGVRFAACENTMRERSISKDDLLPGVTTVPSGAAEVVRKQLEGYGYFKP